MELDCLKNKKKSNVFFLQSFVVVNFVLIRRNGYLHFFPTLYILNYKRNPPVIYLDNYGKQN